MTTKTAVTLKPMWDFLIVELDAEQETTEGGLIVPQQARRKLIPCYVGTVIAAGPGQRWIGPAGTDQHVAMRIKAGDRVLFRPGTGHDVIYGGKHYLAFRETEIIATEN